jgi:hypothetical protein
LLIASLSSTYQKTRKIYLIYVTFFWGQSSVIISGAEKYNDPISKWIWTASPDRSDTISYSRSEISGKQVTLSDLFFKTET